MVGFVILKSSSAHIQRNTQVVAHWGTMRYPLPATLNRPLVVSPTKAHLHTPRGALEHTGRWQPEWGTWKNEHPVQDPSQGCPRWASSLVPKVHPLGVNRNKSLEHLLEVGERRERKGHCQCICKGRTFWHCTRPREYLEEASKVGKARPIGHFPSIGKIRNKGLSWVLSMSVLICIADHIHIHKGSV